MITLSSSSSIHTSHMSHTSTPVRFVTAASLFDGHDVSINIMRRLLQSKGAEVIHLGHNRSASEVVQAALSEDAHAVALSSYQGGHNEYFAYVRELLDQAGGQHIRIFGGGGGVITKKEVEALHQKGITKIYTPEDGMQIGLEGIIDDMIKKASYSTLEGVNFESMKGRSNLAAYQIAKVISAIENEGQAPFLWQEKKTPVLGITGTGGAGKSSLIDELLLRFHLYFKEKKIALISIDPTRKRGQGALLGDRIRLGSASFDQFYIRSMATRDSGTEIGSHTKEVISFLKSQDFDLILVETSGIGQSSDEITRVADKCLYVMTPEYGAQTQLEKIEMLEAADFIALNKFEKMRSEDALRDVRKQYRRNHKLFVGRQASMPDEDLPIFGTIASHFNDPGVNALFAAIVGSFQLVNTLTEKNLQQLVASQISALPQEKASSKKKALISADRILYLREVAKVCRDYNRQVREVATKLDDLQALTKAIEVVPAAKSALEKKWAEVQESIPGDAHTELKEFREVCRQYDDGTYTYQVRSKDIQVKTKYTSLSGVEINKVAIPHFTSWGDQYRFIKLQNLPGFYPYAAGIFPFKRTDEDPKRMFAGEGGPKRTNKRFHFLCQNDPAQRLSTAFDSVTLYGEDPDYRPDIFGKVGESGVSICTLDDMQELFSGFKLTNKNTSVSMTINGPASIILAMFMNAAIRQELSGEDLHNLEKRIEVMRNVRGTVQADILKEDQAQNTCIFSLEFALKLMGDVQEFFCRHQIRNYYTVSISGYHIAEAGANPITQLAFTLANGFTYIEYYLSRGLKIDEICPNLSFFFSNGLDPEYSVLGRVARKIWANALRDRYGANTTSQKLKYHIQTSGRSLHAQEIDFNDIRTTLQAYLALSDNCNSLHTNAYDEAITTPTTESVRRAMAIQMIINREFGLNKSDNPMQGAYLIEELAQLVEEYVLQEFERLSDKGGVLGAMESMYQRSKIQDESIYYETLKDSGELPIIGVNTYIAENISEQMNREIQLIRASHEEKEDQIKRLNDFKARNKDVSEKYLERLKAVALSGGNIFEELLTTVNYCSLGQITNVLYQIGGRYRRNI